MMLKCVLLMTCSVLVLQTKISVKSAPLEGLMKEKWKTLIRYKSVVDEMN